MQPWQIKALELEASGLKHLDGFIHEYALYFYIGAIYLSLALLAWVLSGALRPKGGQPITHVRPVFFIHLPGPPPPPRTRSTRLRRRTIRRIAITIMIIGNDHWRCRVRGEILKSDSHGANGRGGGAERTTVTAATRRIIEAGGTPLILGMTIMGIASIG
jgi:hypothetical protein